MPQGCSRLHEIAAIAASLRPFLEDMWMRDGRGGAAASEGMCGFSAAFCALAMEEAAGGAWRMAGGRPGEGGGVRACVTTERRGHFWAVSCAGEIVDLTGDQFGLPRVVVTEVGDCRYAETIGPAEIEGHLPAVFPVAERWVEEARAEGRLPGAKAFAA